MSMKDNLVKDFKCDKCSKQIDIEDVGFMGDPSGDTTCNPFVTIVTYCRDCFTKRSNTT
jgi:hypothetical protein